MSSNLAIDGEADSRTLTFDWVLGTLLVFALLLTTNTRWSVETVSLAQSHHVSELGFQDNWALPVADVFENRFAEVPFWVFALFAAVLVSITVQKLAIGLSQPGKVAVMIGLALCLEPRDLFALSAIALIAMIQKHCRRFTLPCLAVAVGWTMFSTLEFGLVLVFMTIAFFPERNDREGLHRVAYWKVGLPWLVVILACVISPGFMRSALRPISWCFVPYSTRLIPGLSPPWSAEKFNFGHLCLLLVILECLWREFRGNSSWARKIGMAGLGWLGITCAWYLSLAAAVCVCLRTKYNQKPQVSPRMLIITAACMLVVRASWMVHTNDISVLLGGYSSGVVDVSKWKQPGRVLLTDLSQTSSWDTPARRRKFSLLLTDRWDGASHETFEKYAQVCQDVAVGEQELFLRQDGTYGGYAEVLREYQPSWIVMPLDEIDAIRQLAVSIRWRMVAMDGQRVVFGNQREQMLQATALWFQLEWPSLAFNGTTEGILDLGNPEDQRRISQVFSAMRLPYAALRVLPTDEHIDTEIAKTYARIELAHRAVRQAGQVSLLDHPRAIRAIHQFNNSLFLSAENRRRFADALDSLRTFRVSVHPDTWNEIDVNVHKLVSSGDLSQAKQILEQLPADSPRREIYLTLLEPTRAEDIAKWLQDAVEAAPAELQSEIQFYLACLKLEEGDGFTASEHLLEIQTPSAWAALQSLYLNQLGISKPEATSEN